MHFQVYAYNFEYMHTASWIAVSVHICFLGLGCLQEHKVRGRQWAICHRSFPRSRTRDWELTSMFMRLLGKEPTAVSSFALVSAVENVSTTGMTLVV